MSDSNLRAALDLHRLNENDRIRVIGESVMNAPASSSDKPMMSGFFVDDDTKADRYIAKLQKQFPGIRVIDRKLVHTERGNVVLVRVGSPLR